MNDAPFVFIKEVEVVGMRVGHRLHEGNGYGKVRMRRVMTPKGTLNLLRVADNALYRVIPNIVNRGSVAIEHEPAVNAHTEESVTRSMIRSLREPDLRKTGHRHFVLNPRSIEPFETLLR